MRNYTALNLYGTGQNIQSRMLQNGLTVRDIQKHLGLATPQSVYHWFHGRSLPTVDNLYALSELFHVPVDEMLCGNRKESYTFKRCTCRSRLNAYYEKLKSLYL